MAKNYQWRRHFNLISGGYDGEETGVIPNDQSWQTTDNLSGSVTAEYYYRDSDYGRNADSTRVVVTVKDDWTASIDSRNRLTLNITSTITNIRRDDSRGSGGGGVNRNIYIRRYNGGPIIWSVSDPTTYTHQIASNINLGSYTITLEPGQDATGQSIYFRSVTNGYDNVPPPSPFVDEIAMGVQFKNILPADYRPGAIRDNSGVWLSHNREGGEVHILTPGGTWREERTIAGLEGHDNPPSIRMNDSWYNQRLIGKE